MKRPALLTLTALTLLFAAITAYHALDKSPRIEGTVYADINANGMRDPGEEGIADIAISNGQRVVLTDRKGHYRLPAEDRTTVFVIKPSGYRLPVDELSKTRFYHHLGSATSYDFPLIPKQSPQDDFSILVFGDPQPNNEKQVEYYSHDIIDDIKNPEAFRFGLTLGDIVGNKPELFEPIARTTSRLQVPWWYVIGNHDLLQEAGDRQSARKPYSDRFGPTAYAFNEGQVHFIVLDSIAWRGPRANHFEGGLDEPQLAFIEADLSYVPKDYLIVLAMHVPPLGEWVFKGMFRLEDRKRLFELLDGRPVLSLAAHTHGQLRVDFDETHGWSKGASHHLYIVGATAGDMWSGQPNARGLPDTTMREGTPNGYAIIRFEGNRYQLNWKAAGYPPSYRMRVHGPAVVTPDSPPASRFFYVNYFMGYYSHVKVATPVEYREPEGQWRSMVPSFEADPYRVALEYPWQKAHWQGDKPPAGNPPNSAVPSLHLWKAEIPVHGTPGKRTLEIRVTAKDGRRFYGTYDYEIR